MLMIVLVIKTCLRSLLVSLSCGPEAVNHPSRTVRVPSPAVSGMWAFVVTVLATEPLGWARPARTDRLSTGECAGNRQPLDQHPTVNFLWAVRAVSSALAVSRPFPDLGLRLIGPFGP